MVDGEPTHTDAEPPAEELRERFDFSAAVRGLQVVVDGDQAARTIERSDGAWRDALRLELEARAARFHQAVDPAIVLASDGVIRWLGDPVAKLTGGPNLLTPRAVVLADESLPPEAREIASARIELWLAATTRRLLGPLFALEALQEEAEPVRHLAAEIAQSLGILEREPIRARIKALDQNARAVLRKHGVRFGAYYIYVPSVLKPAARGLALQLWALHTPSVEGDADAIARVLGPYASSGRTSLPLDVGISKDGYRVAGFRPCGDRIVRVDIVERLADMIRAASVLRPAAEAPGISAHGTRTPPTGFAVNGQMTSLTGCSGDQFASILRSMGFEGVEVDRSEIVSSSPTPGSSPNAAPSAPAETLEPEPSEATVPSNAGDEADAAVSDLAPVRSQEPPGEGIDDGNPPVEAVENQTGADKTEGESQPDMTIVASSGPSEANGEKAVSDKIVVWRPVRRQQGARGRTPRRTRRGPSSTEQTIGVGKRDDSAQLCEVSEPEGGLDRRPAKPLDSAPGASRATAHGRPGRNRRAVAPSDEKHRQPGDNRDSPRSQRNPEQQQRTTVDPDSPFAKLLELRQLLEGQNKKRP